MARKASDVTDTELSVLQVLWSRGASTIREAAAILDRANQDAYYATVKKLLERLETKGFVRRKPDGIAFRYEATTDRDELVGQRLQTLADSLCEGSLTPLLTQLAQNERLTKKQQTALLELIDGLDSSEKKDLKSRGRRK